jgi:hypothetical protein
LPHLEDDAPSGLDTPQAEASASIDATDPGAIPGPFHEAEPHDHGVAEAEGDASGA